MIFEKDDKKRALYDLVREEKDRAIGKYGYMTKSVEFYGTVKEETCESLDEVRRVLEICENEFFDASRRKSNDDLKKYAEIMKVHAQNGIAELIQLLAVLDSYKPIK